MDALIGLFLFVVVFVCGGVIGYQSGEFDANARVCTLLATERGDTLAIATEVPECRDHLMGLYMDAREPAP